MLGLTILWENENHVYRNNSFLSEMFNLRKGIVNEEMGLYACFLPIKLMY